MANTKTTAKSTAKKTTTKKTSKEASVKEVKDAKPVAAEAVEKASEPVTQTILYTNAGDQMMTVVHLCLSRTPVSYGNGKKKVFNTYGEKFSISVREFEQEFAPSPVGTALLEQRVLVVSDDCPAEVRDRMNLNYKDGELLTLNRLNALFGMSLDELCELFEALCVEHKSLVVQKFMDDFEAGGRNCDRQKLLKLNELSKKYVKDGSRGMFASLLEDVTNKESQTY